MDGVQTAFQMFRHPNVDTSEEPEIDGFSVHLIPRTTPTLLVRSLVLLRGGVGRVRGPVLVVPWKQYVERRQTVLLPESLLPLPVRTLNRP